mmetsp:Transcript_37817/g.42624  ORF Transcript_37817/g.42624 Transcript_37817/m.42624 type:complete len:575 (-) Transcript_37817:70-1794(-)
MSLVCEISGEPLLGNNNDHNSTVNEIVVTPSGHICIKRLLLAKLLENGGFDPFENTSGRELPLSEDQFVTLQTPGIGGGIGGGSAATVPPRPQATSLPNLLGLLQKEYDAWALELFDTRKTLEDTRRELSQALYQNDAAIRVVARVSQERDAAKQQLEQWNASAAKTGTTTGTTNINGGGTEEESPAPPPPPTDEERENKEPTAKRRRLETNAEVLKNDISDDNIQPMVDIWTRLNKERKPMLKAAALEAPTGESLGKYEFIEKKSWHKSSNRGIPCMAGSDDNFIVTAGKDKQIVVYNNSDQVVQHTFGFGCVATCVDIGNSMVVAGSIKGKITVFSLIGDDNTRGNAGEINVGSKVVDVRVHPTDQHICAATADGRVIIACWIAEEQRLQQVSSFQGSNDDDEEKEEEEYTSAALHPDGLVYVAGTKTGRLLVWDFKNKKLAATMNIPEGEEQEGVSAIAISNNGYLIAAGYNSGTVRFWNLIKQKVVATFKDEQLESINTVTFDQAGKYAAMGGKGGIKITTVKKWDTIATLETKNPVSAIVWSKFLLESSCDKERAVQFHGVPSDGNMEE